MTTEHSPTRNAIARSTESQENDHGFTILLPELLILRLIARSVLLAAALISLPWLRYIYTLPANTLHHAVNEPDQKWVDAPFIVPMLIADLKREGLFSSEMSNVFLGDPGSRVEFLRRNGIEVVAMEYEKMGVVDNYVDFVLASDGLRERSLRFVDRVLKVGGIVAVRLVEDPFLLFRLPVNYRMTYIRKFGSTVVAIKKMSHGNVGKFKDVCVRGRRLLSFVKELREMTVFVQRFGSTVVLVEKISLDNVGEFKGGVRGRKLLSVTKSMDEAPLNETKEKQLKKMTTYRKRFRSNIVAGTKILHRNAGESKGGLRERKLLSVAMLKDKISTDELKEKQSRMITYAKRFGSIIVAIKKILHGHIGGFAEGLRGKKLLSVAKLMGDTPMIELKEKQLKKMAVYIRRFGSTIVAIKKISYANGLRDRMLLLVVKLEGGTPMNDTEEKQLEKITVGLLKLMGDDDASNGHLFEIDYGRKNWKFKGMNLKGKEFVEMEEMKIKEMVGYLMDEMGKEM